ncbi:ferrous iron transporter B [Cutibacterium avidum]|uniref:ferrous iron transporter B n=1 Tax=Cutibacterium avidum TaxID=33010 RepID=UPI0002CCE077|nr:ferrous iron transporter B [Cutibacterium avidum]ERS38207.1 ferrous iron transporter B [Propionibacterium sp. KPL1838]ERS68942.1 ferrous iron transporter B [Propionibacterium sp. KPL1852]AGJ77132.1 ferrous iron transport protein B [Cutibacterium avidum 44067]ERF58994.1 ferrous iron transport protein B [Cutibacterium avidum TM16]MDQ9043082.1 ferrous iron transporter B [Cutibacterium avidum]
MPTPTATSCHAAPTAEPTKGSPSLYLVGSPNGGKTSIFNQLTGLHAKTGNYPGVTVARTTGVCRIGNVEYGIEDLPGAYSLNPISPDEAVVAEALDSSLEGVQSPDGVLVVTDATALRRSLLLLAETLQRNLPTAVVVTMTDELRRRGGSLDTTALSQALGVPVVSVVANRGIGIGELRHLISEWQTWSRPPVLPPTDAEELAGWVDSILASIGYQDPHPDSRTERIDKVLLHPVWGTIIFFLVMFMFFQALFTWAAPFQDAIDEFFGWLGGEVDTHVSNPILAGLLGDGIIGGVGSVLVFVPQILLMFLLLALLDAVGYMSRAAFLMDKVMSRAGLEGRAFVAMLSSFACAIPGIMATRTIPSAKDRIATMLGVPLATCSARLPVYVLLVGMLVPEATRMGPFSGRGVAMFLLYLLGAVSAMAAAWVVKKITDRSGVLLPFYMEMPPYRIPTLRSVGIAMWEPTKAFLRKAGTIIMLTTIVIWALTTFPMRSDAELSKAGVDPRDDVAVAAYTMDHSIAAGVGKAVEPVFEPLGFDWRIDVSLIGSLAAREVAVSTLGQMASATDPEDDVEVAEQLDRWTWTHGEHQGEKVFTSATVVALLLFFAYALQCMSTVAIMKRETGGWKWPSIAFGYMFALAWIMAFIGRLVTNLVI